MTTTEHAPPAEPARPAGLPRLTPPVERPRADCTVDATGRITWNVHLTVPAGARPRLLLRLRPKKGQPETVRHLLDLEPAGPDRLRAVLDPEPVLAEGRWDAYVVPASGDHQEVRQRLLPGLRDLRALVDGRPAGRTASPLAVRIPYATADRYLAVRSWLRRGHAEAAGVRVSGHTLTVRARLYGAGPAAGTTVLLRRRGEDDTALRIEPRAEDGRDGEDTDDGEDFSFTVDYRDLLNAGGSGHEVWDLYVERPGGAPLIRMGRLLDDVAERKKIFVYTAARLGGATVRPYYTLDNDLSVEVTGD
ncbi:MULTISPECIES: transferase [unclassified Streptomyces]|uniref:transferase n=1 Tax=unclassified Streptomyces TaxID=2593676 RepID=UPI003815632E